MILTAFIIHAVLLTVGYWSAVVFARRMLGHSTIQDEPIDAFAQRDSISTFASIVSLGAMGSAAILYGFIAVALREDDTPARSLLGAVMPWVYGIYGAVVLPSWILFLESRVNRSLRRMRYFSAITAIALAIAVWLGVLRHIAWFPGA